MKSLSETKVLAVALFSNFSCKAGSTMDGGGKRQRELSLKIDSTPRPQPPAPEEEVARSPRRGGGWARAARPAEPGPARGGDSGRSLRSGAGSGERSSAVLSVWLLELWCGSCANCGGSGGIS